MGPICDAGTMFAARRPYAATSRASRAVSVSLHPRSQSIQRAIEPAIAAAFDPFKTQPPGQVDALGAKHPHLGMFETVRHQAEPEASRHHRERARIAVGL